MVDISNQQYKISLKDFKDMIERVNKFILKKKREPAIVYVNPNNSTFYVNYQRFNDMLQRYKKFIRENNREPNYISVLPPTTSTSKNLGFWIRGSDTKNIDLSKLKSVACTDIFLGETAFNSNLIGNVIQKAKKQGIRVHGWIICLKKNGDWYSPTDTSNFNRVNNLASKMVNLGCSGIHLDYIRYPGTAYKYKDASTLIENFIIDIHKNVKTIHGDVILSAAVMPEMEANAYYYGQDYTKMGKWLDIIIPMAYKGNYRENTQWVGKVVKYIIEKSGKPVWAGLQTYRSDDDPTPIPESELREDMQMVYSNGGSGCVLFRYGLTDPKLFSGEG